MRASVEQNVTSSSTAVLRGICSTIWPSMGYFLWNNQRDQPDYISMYPMYVCFGPSPTPDLHAMSLLLALGQLLLLLALPHLYCASNSTQWPLDRQAEALLKWKSGLLEGGSVNTTLVSQIDY
jgi:hypothetical protein